MISIHCKEAHTTNEDTRISSSGLKKGDSFLSTHKKTLIGGFNSSQKYGWNGSSHYMGNSNMFLVETESNHEISHPQNVSASPARPKASKVLSCGTGCGTI